MAKDSRDIKLASQEKALIRKAAGILAILLVIPALLLFANWLKLVEAHGAWLWAIWLVPVGGIVILTVRYPGFRSALTRAFHFASQVFEGSRRKKRTKVPEAVRARVYKRAGYKCQWRDGKRRCQQIIYEVHHINGNPTDHKLSNLIALCSNHHDQAPLLPNRGMLRLWARESSAVRGKQTS